MISNKKGDVLRNNNKLTIEFKHPKNISYHTCRGTRVGDWIVYRCDECDYELRDNLLTGEMIVVKTLDGQVASLEPTTAVAWFGQRQKPDKTWGSAGCFHQGFFTTPEHLRKWLDQHPLETGKLITIQQALADKMKLTPQQIQKACKIGECSPK